MAIQFHFIHFSSLRQFSTQTFSFKKQTSSASIYCQFFFLTSEAVRPTENRSHQEPKIADESALFDRPATMMFLKPDGSVKQKQHGKIQIVGDSEMSGFRIRFINETDGIVALDQVITMQMKVKVKFVFFLFTYLLYRYAK